MDMRIEAAPMAAEAIIARAFVKIVHVTFSQVISLVKRVASFSCPSLGGHSLSAVAPHDNILEEGLVQAA